MDQTQHKSAVPKLFEEGTKPFWTVPHIAKKMLQVHLDPETDKASRKPEFIDRSVQWLDSIIPKKSSVLDLGCGPGLYTERLAKLGHECKGIDFSDVSIQYARSLKSTVDYVHGNYLEVDFGEDYDLIILIYCDFGVFSPENQRHLLNKMFRALKPGGQLVIDVFTPVYFQNFEEEFEQSDGKGGFWAEGKYRLIKECYKYPESLTVLGQYHLIEQNNKELFRIWSMCYELSDFKDLLAQSGFENIQPYGNVCGDVYDPSSEVMAVSCQKPSYIN